jgi:hypothetical protein
LAHFLVSHRWVTEFTTARIARNGLRQLLKRDVDAQPTHGQFYKFWNVVVLVLPPSRRLGNSTSGERANFKSQIAAPQADIFDQTSHALDDRYQATN